MDDLKAPGRARGEELVGVDLVGPPDEVLLRLVIRAAVEGRTPGVGAARQIVAPLERGQALFDRTPFRIPFAHRSKYRGPVAQSVEQGTFNPKVAGSIPARPTELGSRRTLFFDPNFSFTCTLLG